MTRRELRRCRPLLGTFVEITARGRDEALLARAVARALARIEALQAHMNAHDPASELSRLNRDGHARAVPVGTELWRVLRAAARLARESGGAFDVTLGAGAGSGLAFLPGRQVRFTRPLCVDLGGIAKGYCVDRAVDALVRNGAECGLVNAGGDMRAFGPASFPLHLRHPGDSGRFLRFGVLRQAALATSASYAAGNARRSARGGSDVAPGLSVSVRAPRAMLADALTKVVAVAGQSAAPLLERYGASAWVFSA